MQQRQLITRHVSLNLITLEPTNPHPIPSLDYTRCTNCSVANETRLEIRSYFIYAYTDTHVIHENTGQIGAIGKKIGMRSDLSYAQENEQCM